MKVAFIGHRKISKSEALGERLTKTIERLIVNECVDTFYFGSRSEFDELCYEIVTELKARYPHIIRVFVRAEYEYVNRDYIRYLLTIYDQTYFPESVHGAGALSHIKRNREMIDKCDILVAYCDENYAPKTGTKSGTKLAVAYARKKNKRIINLFE